MSLDLASGPAQILAQGSATTFFGHPLTLTLGTTEGPVRVTLRFEPSEADSPAPRVDSYTDPSGLVLTCHGFDHADGRGSSEPVLLAEVGEDLVFLHFRVHLFGRTEDRTVHFTFYRVPKRDVAWNPSMPEALP